MLRQGLGFSEASACLGIGEVISSEVEREGGVVFLPFKLQQHCAPPPPPAQVEHTQGTVCKRGSEA